MSVNLIAFTLVHVVISLVGIVAGLIVVYGLVTSNRMENWTGLFLATTVTTSVTGFGFPFSGVLPAHVLGVLSLVVLAPAIYGRYARNMAGAWRWVYVIGAVVALYFNVFVLIVQMFQKIPALRTLAPTQTELPFQVAQLGAFVFFAAVAILATLRFHPMRAAAVAIVR
jgi:hypothetical protein